MSVTLEDPIKEVADLMESNKEEGWEKSQAHKQVTFVVYREGDQLNFFRVVDRGDGTLTPLSESLRFEVFFICFLCTTVSKLTRFYRRLDIFHNCWYIILFLLYIYIV